MAGAGKTTQGPWAPRWARAPSPALSFPQASLAALLHGPPPPAKSASPERELRFHLVRDGDPAPRTPVPAPCRGSALATPARCERSAGGKMSVAVLGLSCEGPGALPQGWRGWEGPGGLVRVSPGCGVPGSHCLQTLKFSYAVVFFSE